MKYIDCTQGTEEWKKHRLGKCTASMFNILMGKTFGKTVYNYAYELIAESLTGMQKEVSARPLEWGTEHEPDARFLYEHLTFTLVRQVGFAEYSDMIGCSPDGLIGDDGLQEIKCPYNSSNHVISLVTKEVPKIYKAQVQGNLWITDRQWCHFVSYDPRFPEGKQLIIIKSERDEAYIEMLKGKVFEFVKLVESLRRKL